MVGVGSAVLDIETGDMKDYLDSTKYEQTFTPFPLVDPKNLYLFRFRHLISLQPRVALPAHGPPNFSATALLETYLKHRQAREDAILAVLKTGRTKIDDIIQEVYKDTPPHLQKIARSNVELHLRKLKTESKY